MPSLHPKHKYSSSMAIGIYCQLETSSVFYWIVYVNALKWPHLRSCALRYTYMTHLLVGVNASGYIMMTSSNGNIFRVTGPLWGESTGHRWIPLTKASDAELWYFLWSAPEQRVEQTIETPGIWDAIAPIMTSLSWRHCHGIKWNHCKTKQDKPAYWIDLVHCGYVTKPLRCLRPPAARILLEYILQFNNNGNKIKLRITGRWGGKSTSDVTVMLKRWTRIRKSLKWRHNGRYSVSNHLPHDCLLNRYSDADQRKHQSSASLAFVWGIHRGPVNFPHKWPVTRKMFPFDDVIMWFRQYDIWPFQCQAGTYNTIDSWHGSFRAKFE